MIYNLIRTIWFSFYKYSSVPAFPSFPLRQIAMQVHLHVMLTRYRHNVWYSFKTFYFSTTTIQWLLTALCLRVLDQLLLSDFDFSHFCMWMETLFFFCLQYRYFLWLPEWIVALLLLWCFSFIFYCFHGLKDKSLTGG